MKKDLAKQIYKDSGWQIDKDTKTTDYKPAPYCIFGEDNAGKVPVGREDGLIEFKDYEGGGTITLPLNYQDDNQITNKPVIPHKAIEQYTQLDPFNPEVANLPADWLKFIHNDNWDEYALWFRSKQLSSGYIPIRVLTQWDLFNDNNANCVKLTANENSSIEVIKNGTISVDLQYSFDGIQWEVYTNYTRTLNVAKGQTVLFKGNNPTGFNTDTDNYVIFNVIGNISISGNIMGLIDNGTGSILAIPNDYCFYGLFRYSTGITSVSENFLPATTLKLNCYESMFYQCTSLTTAPNLPATNLAVACYRGMFFRCYKLEKAPELPALTLQQDCYKGMFKNCTSLIQAPELPATTLAEGCYQGIFSGCSSLFSVKILYTGNFADTTNAFNNWLLNTPSYALIYYNGSDTTTGVSAIPTGWQKVTF